MSIDWEALGSEGIRFLARIGASGAREAVRHLAQVERQAEQADLLAEQAERGLCPNPEQLAQLAARLKEATAQAEADLRPLVDLAEDVRTPVGLVNVSQTLERMALLLRPKARRLGVGLAVRGSDRPVFAASNAFFLQNLLYAGLDLALDSCMAQQAPGAVEAVIGDGDGGPEVELSCPLVLINDPVRSAKLEVLAQCLEARLGLDDIRITISLPSRSSLIKSLAEGS